MALKSFFSIRQCLCFETTPKASTPSPRQTIRQFGATLLTVPPASRTAWSEFPKKPATEGAGASVRASEQNQQGAGLLANVWPGQISHCCLALGTVRPFRKWIPTHSACQIVAPPWRGLQGRGEAETKFRSCHWQAVAPTSAFGRRAKSQSRMADKYEQNPGRLETVAVDWQRHHRPRHCADIRGCGQQGRHDRPKPGLHLTGP